MIFFWIMFFIYQLTAFVTLLEFLFAPFSSHGLVCYPATGSKAIEQIAEGDEVWAADEITGERSLRRVVRVTASIASALLVLHTGGEAIAATESHPLWVEGTGMTAAANIQVGARLQTRSGSSVEVTRIERKEGEFRVFNFEVEGAHTYFVGKSEVWTHNSCFVSSQTGNTSRNSGLLRQSMGLQTGAGKDAHHIVASTHARATEAREILDKYHIDINSAENGVALRPTGPRPAHHGNGLHSEAAIDAVTQRLRDATRGLDFDTGRRAALSEIEAIRQEILSGSFP